MDDQIKLDDFIKDELGELVKEAIGRIATKVVDETVKGEVMLVAASLHQEIHRMIRERAEFILHNDKEINKIIRARLVQCLK